MRKAVVKVTSFAIAVGCFARIVGVVRISSRGSVQGSARNPVDAASGGFGRAVRRLEEFSLGCFLARILRSARQAGDAAGQTQVAVLGDGILLVANGSGPSTKGIGNSAPRTLETPASFAHC